MPPNLVYRKYLAIKPHCRFFFKLTIVLLPIQCAQSDLLIPYKTTTALHFSDIFSPVELEQLRVMRKPARRPKEMPPPLVDILPCDILVEILARVAASCPRPLSTLKSIRQMCRGLYQASKGRKVGFSMNLGWRDWDLQDYFTLVDNCARAGNLEANCILGLELLHNRGVKRDGIRYLSEAMAGGHKVAAYLLGVLLFSTDESRLFGIQILNKMVTGHGDFTEHRMSTESGLSLIRGYRREAAKMLRGTTWKKLFPCKPDMPCMNHCRRVVEIVDAWMGERIEIFCSPVCRWANEYNCFIEFAFNL